jgi:hypothetical protein
MLNTINGFDLLLVIIITGLIIWNRNLNRECQSYVDQIIEVSQDNYRLSEQIHDLKYPTAERERYGCICSYCTGSDEWATKCEDSF